MLFELSNKHNGQENTKNKEHRVCVLFYLHSAAPTVSVFELTVSASLLVRLVAAVDVPIALFGGRNAQGGAIVRADVIVGLAYSIG